MHGQTIRLSRHLDIRMSACKFSDVRKALRVDGPCALGRPSTVQDIRMSEHLEQQTVRPRGADTLPAVLFGRPGSLPCARSRHTANDQESEIQIL